MSEVPTGSRDNDYLSNGAEIVGVNGRIHVTMKSLCELIRGGVSVRINVFGHFPPLEKDGLSLRRTRERKTDFIEG
jgi:hypothetical protein